MSTSTRQISEKIVADLPPPAKDNRRDYFSGAVLQGKKAPSGFGVCTTWVGTKSFFHFYRVAGKPYYPTLGRWVGNAKGGDLTVLQAIIACQEHAKEIREGADPRPKRTRRIEDGDKPKGETFGDMLDRYIARARHDGKLRSLDDIQSAFIRLVKPAIGGLGLYEVRRKHIVEMLDDIADKSGPVMADRTLAYVRKACGWQATRDDQFVPPIVRGMARTNAGERARQRTLSDDEIRAIWRAADGGEPSGALIKFLLLTGARRSEASRMTWAEIEDTDWTLPAARNKTKLDLVRPLSKTALALLEASRKSMARASSLLSTAERQSTASGNIRRGSKRNPV